MNKPLLVIVSGRPGSGKSTLAHLLAKEIRCPLISRDELKEGFINTVKREHHQTTEDEKLLIFTTFFKLIETLLDSNIGAIAESAFQNKVWSSKYDLLSKKARIKLIVCTLDSKLANKRYLERKKNDTKREYYHGDSIINTEDDDVEYIPPDLPVPALTVDTTD